MLRAQSLPPSYIQQNAIPGVYNLNPSNLSKWRKAVANVLSGTADGKLACVGDSNTMGRGAGTGAEAFGGARAKSYPSYLASVLSSMGVAAQANNMFGTGNVTNPLTDGYDPRVSFGSGWTTNTLASLGGPAYFNNSTTNALAFTPTAQVDTFDVYWLKVGGLGTFTVNVDGGATLATCSGSGAQGTVAKATVSTTLGAHTLNLLRSSGICWVVGIDAYNSTAKNIHVLNLGASGYKASGWSDTTNYYSPINALPALGADLTLICLGLNDGTTDADTTAFSGRVQSIITAAKTTGDVALVVPQRCDPSYTTTARFDSIRAATYALADTNNLPLIDISVRMDYATYNALGYYQDTVHPNSLGYADIGQAVARIIGRP